VLSVVQMLLMLLAGYSSKTPLSHFSWLKHGFSLGLAAVLLQAAKRVVPSLSRYPEKEEASKHTPLVRNLLGGALVMFELFFLVRVLTLASIPMTPILIILSTRIHVFDKKLLSLNFHQTSKLIGMLVVILLACGHVQGSLSESFECVLNLIIFRIVSEMRGLLTFRGGFKKVCIRIPSLSF